MRLSVTLEKEALHYVVETKNETREAWQPFDEKRVQGLCRELLQLAQSMAARPGATAQGALAQLETLTRAMTCLLLPDAMLDALRQASEHAALSVDPQLDFIPWEWLHDGEDFWMRRHFLGRLPARAPVPLDPPGRPIPLLVVVADPDRDLPNAIPEARRLVRELDRERVFAARLTVNPRVDELIRLFNMHAVVHYIGHTIVAESSGGRVPAWKLADGAFGPAEIAAATFGGARVRLVFSNACPGAAMDPQLGSALPRAMQKVGIPAVIASLVDVPDRTAVEMSAGFYHDLAAGRRVGDVLALARERARKRLGSADITWMAHTLYGDPEAALFSESPASGETARVRLPGAVPYKPLRSAARWRVWGRRFELALLLALAGVTAFQLARPLFAVREAFSPVMLSLSPDDVSGRVLFSGFSGGASPDEILEAEQCFIRSLSTLTEIRLEDARGIADAFRDRKTALEITGRVVASSSGGNKLLLWVRRASDRVVLYADDFPLPMLDETPCARLQDWIRHHRER